MIATIFETFMIVLFGASWPFNVIKSYRVRTAKGKSVLFLSLIEIGYVCGIISKILLAVNGAFFTQWVHYLLFFFYCFNLIMVSADFVLYFRNRGLDAKAEARKEKSPSEE